ncbi:MAG: MEDS domain-containing protein [Tissierellales bacterium]|jgi:hypothetical protein|nr:MEDS domain-containing protein [Tissierellales bacterium]
MSFKVSDGSHIVALYTDDEALIKAIVEFFADGLRKNEVCVYGASKETIEKVKFAFQREGIDVNKYIEKEQLYLFDDREVFLLNGKFEPNHMLKCHKNLISGSFKKGFERARVTLEMTWVIDGVPGGEDILKYEALSNSYFNNTDRINAICQYNNAKLSGNQIVELMKIHPSTLLDQDVSANPYFTDPKVEDYE